MLYSISYAIQALIQIKDVVAYKHKLQLLAKCRPRPIVQVIRECENLAV